LRFLRKCYPSPELSLGKYFEMTVMIVTFLTLPELILAIFLNAHIKSKNCLELIDIYKDDMSDKVIAKTVGFPPQYSDIVYTVSAKQFLILDRCELL
jgi:hypothetical protein